MLVFKTALLSDVDRIQDLVNSAYRGPSSKRGWTTEADILTGTRTSSDHLREMIREADSQIELAYEQDILIACVAIKKEKSGTLYFGMLTVKPEIQARGIGKALILHVEQMALSLQCRGLRISVIHVRSELIAYYERRGFVATGVSEPFVFDETIFGKPLVEGLTLIEMIKDL